MNNFENLPRDSLTKSREAKIGNLGLVSRFGYYLMLMAEKRRNHIAMLIEMRDRRIREKRALKNSKEIGYSAISKAGDSKKPNN